MHALPAARLFTTEQLQTAFALAEGALNARPLAYVSGGGRGARPPHAEPLLVWQRQPSTLRCPQLPQPDDGPALADGAGGGRSVLGTPASRNKTLFAGQY